MRTEHLFVVRVWSDHRTPGSDWRGFIEHVPSRQRVYFRDPSEVLDVLLLRLRETQPGCDADALPPKE